MEEKAKMEGHGEGKKKMRQGKEGHKEGMEFGYQEGRKTNYMKEDIPMVVRSEGQKKTK